MSSKIILTLFLFFAIGVLAFYMLINATLQTRRNREVEPTPTPISEGNSLTPNQESNGIIEGSLSFPSEGIPEDMTVCAVNQETNKHYCTQEQIENQKYKYGKGFLLEVPPGDYVVYAQTASLGDYKAYYSDFVECGLSVDCSSHEVIIVRVKPGTIESGVDPQDWYNIEPET